MLGSTASQLLASKIANVRISWIRILPHHRTTKGSVLHVVELVIVKILIYLQLAFIVHER
jgi:hypothetical protein